MFNFFFTITFETTFYYLGITGYEKLIFNISTHTQPLCKNPTKIIKLHNYKNQITITKLYKNQTTIIKLYKNQTIIK